MAETEVGIRVCDGSGRMEETLGGGMGRTVHSKEPFSQRVEVGGAGPGRGREGPAERD